MTGAPSEVDFAVVGAGILGLAVARELGKRWPDRRIAVLERNREVGTGQTGANSGVIHAGIYYMPGSLKARLCVTGARELYSYCEQHSIPHERCGKLIVARHNGELGRLDELERRGRENGVSGLRRLNADELRAVEPHARGAAALDSPSTGIVDFAAVARSMAAGLRDRDAEVVTACAVETVSVDGNRVVLGHSEGDTRAGFAVFSAGAAADRLAVAAGASPDPRIVPFKGSYLYLRPERAHLVKSLIYPVPDPDLPFLGVHLSRHIDGRVSLGPSALLWPRNAGDVAWPGTLRVARRWWRTGRAELRHALRRETFAAAAAQYVPEIRPEDFDGGFHGIRAQAIARDGRLVDDFIVSETPRALHVRNAPSPAATSSLALARLICDRVEAETA
jgi:(S)-2-hydroxyglutarate dehydrogenase